MRKIPLLLFLCTLFLTGCAREDMEPIASTQESATSTVSVMENTTTAPFEAAASPIPSAENTALPSTVDNSIESVPLLIEGYTEAESEIIRSELQKRIVYRKTSLPVTEVWLDGTDANTGRYLGTLFLTKDSQFHSLNIENNIQALTMDGKEWLAVTVKANVLTDDEISTYEDSILEIMIPLNRDANGNISFGEYYATTKNTFSSTSEDDTEPDYVPTRLYMTKADLTHDGIDDYIETCLYFSPEADMTTDMDALIQKQIWATWATVQVYDGSTATAENFGQPIWSGDYSAAHAGNGQLSIVNKDGHSYLLITSLWQGQGFTDYFFEVIALDSQGHKYIIDRQTMDFSENDSTLDEQKQLVSSFREQLVPWLNDSQLIIATDVSLDTQFITTDRKQFTPQEYYDIAWQQWN